MATTSLKVMASLVRPRLSGTKVFEGAFFDELITVFYRIAMTEGAAVKGEMVGVVEEFAVSRRGLPG